MRELYRTRSLLQSRSCRKAVPTGSPWPVSCSTIPAGDQAGWRQEEDRSMDSVVRQDRVNMSQAEWQARCDLAALYRITDLYGWTDTINTHMSARIPGEPKCFLINNYGDLFHEITASSLVKMDLDGKVHIKNCIFTAPGFSIHSRAYKARPDANRR